MIKIIQILILFNLSVVYSQWSVINVPQVHGGDILAMTRDSSGFIYAATQDYQIFRSSNEGLTWQVVNSNIPQWTITAMISTPSNVLFATAGSGIYNSSNQGLIWYYSSAGILDFNDWCFEYLNGVIYVGTGHYTYRSTDEGNNWSYAGTGNGNYTQTFSMARSKNCILAASEAGTLGLMYRTIDSGRIWTLQDTGLSEYLVNSMGHYNQYVYATINYYDGHLYRTQNLGTNWSQVSNITNVQNFFSNDTIIVVGQILHLRVIFT